MKQNAVDALLFLLTMLVINLIIISLVMSLTIVPLLRRIAEALERHQWRQ